MVQLVCLIKQGYLPVVQLLCLIKQGYLPVVQLLCLIKQGYLPITRHESDLSDNSVVKRINECLGEGRNSSIDSLFSGKLAIFFVYIIKIT